MRKKLADGSEADSNLTEMRNIRVSLGWTQDRMAKGFLCNRGRISHLEAGHRPPLAWDAGVYKVLAQRAVLVLSR